jgi:hypothetical protein
MNIKFLLCYGTPPSNNWTSFSPVRPKLDESEWQKQWHQEQLTKLHMTAQSNACYIAQSPPTSRLLSTEKLGHKGRLWSEYHKNVFSIGRKFEAIASSSAESAYLQTPFYVLCCCIA